MCCYSGSCGNRSIHRDYRASFFRNQSAAVAHLPAGLGIKRRAVENDLTIQNRKHGCRSFQCFPANELGLGQGLINRIDLSLVGALPTRASACALLFHFGIEACGIRAGPILPRHIFLLVQGQAKRVVQLERHLARNDTALLGFRLKHLFGHLKRGGVAMLFFLHHARDPLDALHQLRISRLHQLRHEAGELIKIRFLLTDHARIPDGPAHDFTQHVAAAFVGWQHAVVNQKSGRTAMIGIDP